MEKRAARPLIISLLFILRFITSPGYAAASLGGDSQSVITDGDVLAAHRDSSQNRGLYSVTVLRTNSVTVREYLTQGGNVFAIAWEGLTQPDLSKLLGPLYGEFQKASIHPPGGRRQIHSIESEHMVVRSAGHMRHQKGIAYVRTMVPAGVNIRDLQ